jgi:hypothetical protein
MSSGEWFMTSTAPTKDEMIEKAEQYFGHDVDIFGRKVNLIVLYRQNGSGEHYYVTRAEIYEDVCGSEQKFLVYDPINDLFTYVKSSEVEIV